MMKNIYSAPEFKLILLNAQNILNGSVEQDFEEPDNNTDPSKPSIWN